MLIKLTGGWVSVRHVQAITPRKKSPGSRIQLVDGVIEVDEDPDFVASIINEIRAAEATLREIYTKEDVDIAADLLQAITAQHLQGKKEESDDVPA